MLNIYADFFIHISKSLTKNKQENKIRICVLNVRKHVHMLQIAHDILNYIVKFMQFFLYVVHSNVNSNIFL